MERDHDRKRSESEVCEIDTSVEFGANAREQAQGVGSIPRDRARLLL